MSNDPRKKAAAKPADVGSLLNILAGNTKANSGKGVPIYYTLMPLSAIKTHLGNIKPLDRIVNSIDEDAISETVRIFDEMNESVRELNDVYDDFEKYSYCIMDDVMDSVLNQKQIVQRAQTDIKTKLHKAIVAIRNGMLSSSDEIYNIIKSYENSPASRSKVNDFINSLRSSRDKIDFVALMQKQGAYYLRRGMSLYTLRMRNKIEEYYVFFCSWKDPNLVKNKTLFNELYNNDDYAFFFLISVTISYYHFSSYYSFKKVSRVTRNKLSLQFTSDYFLF